MASPLLTYLVSHRKVLAILSAPADSAIQTLVDVTIPLIRSVPAVVSAVAEAPLRDAAAVGAHEEGAVAQASWKTQDPARHGPNSPLIPRQTWGALFFGPPQWILTDQFLPRRARADPGPFVLAICSRRFPRRAALLLTLMKRFLLRAKQPSYLQPDI